MYKIKLTFSQDSQEFAVIRFDNLTEFILWEHSLKMRVIKSDIWSSYNCKKLIGQGASSKVFLADQVKK